MKGMLFLGDKEVVVRDFPNPEPGSGQIVLRLKTSGLCGTDMHPPKGFRSSKEEIAKYEDPLPSLVPRPIIRGHEPCGVVEKVGDGVTELKVGDRVVAHHAPGCGQCSDCLDGYHMYCKNVWVLGRNVHGGFAEMLRTRALGCLKLPDTLSFEDGAIAACAGGTAYQILRDLNLTARDDLAVYGLGPLGLAATMIGKSMGAKVIGVDTVEERTVLAKRLGADEVVRAGQEDPLNAIMSITEGRGASVAVDFSGNSKAQTNAMNCAARFGRIGLIGARPELGEPLTISVTDIRRKRLRIAGNWIFKISTCVEMLGFMARRNMHFDRMVTHRFPLEKAQEAFQIFDAGKTGKVVFTW